MEATKTARSIVTSSPPVMNNVQPKRKTSSPSDDYRHATGAFNNLIDAVGVCIKYKSAYCEFERTQDQLSSATLQLNEVTTDRDKARERYNSGVEEHELRVSAWATEKKGLNQKNEELAEQLAKERQRVEELKYANVRLANDKRELERSNVSLRADSAQERQKASDTEKALHEARKMIGDLTTGKKESERRLDLYESYIRGLHDIDVGDFSKNINTFWTHCKGFVEKYFLADISTDLFVGFPSLPPSLRVIVVVIDLNESYQASAQWDPIIDKLQLTRDVPPLPLRNSAVAKKARMTAALAVIASHLSTRIFTPVYMPAANEGIRELLRACAEVDCKREAMCRALMLSAYEDDEQSHAVNSTILGVYNTVSEILEPLIEGTKLDTFRTELRDLFGGAVALWRRAQYSTIKFDATVDGSYAEDSDWNTFLDDSKSEEASAATQSQATLPPARTFVMLALFPRIVVVQEERDEVVFPGIVLRDWQAAEAAQQLREDIDTRRVARGNPRRERKGTMGGTGSSPSSPTNAKHPAFLG